MSLNWQEMRKAKKDFPLAESTQTKAQEANQTTTKDEGPPPEVERLLHAARSRVLLDEPLVGAFGVPYQAAEPRDERQIRVPLRICSQMSQGGAAVC